MQDFKQLAQVRRAEVIVVTLYQCYCVKQLAQVRRAEVLCMFAILTTAVTKQLAQVRRAEECTALEEVKFPA